VCTRCTDSHFPVSARTPTPGFVFDSGDGGVSAVLTGGTPTPTPVPCDCNAGGAFQLVRLDSTAIEIALAWQKVPGVTTGGKYTVLRCDQMFSADVSVSVNSYADTGLAADAEFRFSPGGNRVSPYLQLGQSYIYQVLAKFPDQSILLSNCSRPSCYRR